MRVFDLHGVFRWWSGPEHASPNADRVFPAGAERSNPERGTTMEHALTPEEKKLLVRVQWEGLKFVAYQGSFGMFRETWIKKLYDLPGFQIGPGMNIVDIGAHQGFFAIYAAQKGATVHAYEPQEFLYKVLQYNFASNKENGQLPGVVRAHNRAVWNACEEIPIYIPSKWPRRCANASTSSDLVETDELFFKTGEYTESSVPAVSLDSIFEEGRIETCEFLKMDCEGSEFEILRVASDDTWRKIERLAMETHEGYQEQTMLDLLRDHDFEILIQEPREGRLPYGFVKAVKKQILAAQNN
ncbi:MAG: hypothetical protein CMJ81_10480 [Planctomycetaceae bacterium]|nr:hypothetical protein [Planctomycetaceae bacterium]